MWSTGRIRLCPRGSAWPSYTTRDTVDKRQENGVTENDVLTAQQFVKGDEAVACGADPVDHLWQGVGIQGAPVVGV